MEDKILFLGISILLLGVVFIWFVRFFGELGVRAEGKRFLCWCGSQRTYQPEALGRKEAVQLFGQAFAVRLAVYLLGVFICRGYVDYYKSLGQFGFEEFLQSWMRWDAKHYINLAELGYMDYIEDGQHLFLVFFPLYPWILRVFHLVIADWRLACLIVSTLCFCIGSVFFYGVIKEEYGGDIAKRSFYLLCCFPFSFFFGGMMTESLFFCLLAAGFYFIRRHNWFVAGVLGIFCALCRIQGVLLLGVGLVEFFVAYRPIEKIREGRFSEFLKAFFTKGIWLFLTPIGNLVYFEINRRVEGEPFRFRYYQKEHWYHTTTWISNCVSEIIQNMKTASPELRFDIWIPELVLFCLAILCIIYAIRRHPLRYSAFLIVYTVLNYSITFLISGGRYMLCALPMFVILAEWTKKHRWIYFLLLLVSTSLLGVYLWAYMSGRQVM